MCHQSVGLIQSVIEKAGIPTVSITMLPELTQRVGPPRALSIDRPLGYPLGSPHDSQVQKRILTAALQLLSLQLHGPLISEFPRSDCESYPKGNEAANSRGPRRRCR